MTPLAAVGSYNLEPLPYQSSEPITYKKTTEPNPEQESISESPHQNRMIDLYPVYVDKDGYIRTSITKTQALASKIPTQPNKTLRLNKLKKTSFTPTVAGMPTERINKEIETSKIMDALVLGNFHNTLKNDFIRSLPKPDPHVHRCGYLPPEKMIDLSEKENNIYLNKAKTKLYSTNNFLRDRIPITDLDSKAKKELCTKMILDHENSPNIENFRKFFQEIINFRGDLIDLVHPKYSFELIVKEALKDNTRYMELMCDINPQKVPKDFEKIYKKKTTDEFLADPKVKTWIDNYVKTTIDKLDESEKYVSEKCEKNGQPIHFTDPNSAVCLGLIHELMRTENNYEFLTKIDAIATLCEKDKRILGLTIDGPQNDDNAQENFDKQQDIIKDCLKKHPHLKITIHAGEYINFNLHGVKDEFAEKEIDKILTNCNNDDLTSSKQPRPSLRFGHLASAKKQDLFMRLKRSGCAVEISLLSYKVLLNKDPSLHPLNEFRHYGIPIILCSDDPGVWGGSLTEEYYKVVKDFRFNYTELKQILRNGIRYGFLPGEEIFEYTENNTYQLKECFKNIYDPNWDPNTNPQAQQILQNSPKAHLQFNQERQIIAFEDEIIEKLNSFVLQA